MAVWIRICWRWRLNRMIRCLRGIRINMCRRLLLKLRGISKSLRLPIRLLSSKEISKLIPPIKNLKMLSKNFQSTPKLSNSTISIFKSWGRSLTKVSEKGSPNLESSNTWSLPAWPVRLKSKRIRRYLRKQWKSLLRPLILRSRQELFTWYYNAWKSARNKNKSCLLYMKRFLVMKSFQAFSLSRQQENWGTILYSKRSPFILIAMNALLQKRLNKLCWANHPNSSKSMNFNFLPKESSQNLKSIKKSQKRKC